MRIPIRMKLAGALAVPMVALVGVAAYEVQQADAVADEVQSETELATAAVGPGSLVVALQDERNYSLGARSGFAEMLELPFESYEEARANTDGVRADLESFVADRGGDVAAAYGPALEAIDAALDEVRNDIDTTSAAPGINPENSALSTAAFAQFSLMIQSLIDAGGDVALGVDDAVLRTGVELVTLATLNGEQGTQVTQAILSPVVAGDPIPPVQIAASALMADFRSQQAAMLARATGPYAGLPEVYVDSEANAAQLAVWDNFLATGQADLTSMTQTVNDNVAEGGPALLAGIAAALDEHATGLVDDAQAQRTTVLLLSVVLVGAALAVTLLASRSITNPLRSLTTQARSMATERLPHAVQQVLDTPAGEDVVVPEVAPIQVNTRDEVADVATALNTVQTSALDLAVEQAALRKNIADSFVNLGRRNQNLLDRQLEFITDLEREEQEPERLEYLFRLDHLATRMRRNAESLLRLAGGSDSANAGWGGPVPMVDVVRGALGEVEEYDRVDVKALEPAVLSASAGSDLAHALAELVENALHFSPPSERVQIRGRRGEDGGYVLAVLDQGMGMTEEQLETANRRLAGQESFTVAPSRYLGHYVAGHLASTLGLTITLSQQAIGGIIARVDIPEQLLLDPSEALVPTEPVAEAWTPEPVEPVEAVPEPEPVADTWTPEPVEPAEAVPEPEPVAAWPEPAMPLESVGAPPVSGLAGPSGLPRRLRGANAPTTTNVAAAFGGQIPADEHRPMVRTPDDVGSFLSAFSAGVERGRTDGDGEDEQP